MKDFLKSIRDIIGSKEMRGFTLIELLIVIAIIGTLAAIALFQYQDYYQRAVENEMVSDVKNAGTAMESLFADCQTYAGANISVTTGAAPAPYMATLTIAAGGCVSGMTANQNVRISRGNTLGAPGGLSASTYQITVGNPNGRTNRTNVRIDQTGSTIWF